jgi:hypothetical protein
MVWTNSRVIFQKCHTGGSSLFAKSTPVVNADGYTVVNVNTKT